MTKKVEKKKGYFENPSAKWIVLGAVLLFLTLVVSVAVSSFKGKDVSGVNLNALVNDGEAYISLVDAKDETLRYIFRARNDFYLNDSNHTKHERAFYWMFKTENDIYVYCIDLGTLAKYNQTRTVTSTST